VNAPISKDPSTTHVVLRNGGNRRRFGRRRQQLVAVCRAAFFTLLTLLVVVDLLQTAESHLQIFKTAGLLSGVAPLDSFSQPSVAVSLLKHDAEESLAVFNELRNEAEYPISAASVASQRPRTKTLSEPADWKTTQLSETEIQSVQHLASLRARVHDLSEDLDRKLLLVYLKTHQANEVVDRFLQLLRGSPDSPELLEWVGTALNCAKVCGRVEEVRDALEHVLRFHGSLPTADGLKFRIQQWETAGSTHTANLP
jgi:hypothetical protein